tara:strand:- start:653 stop:1378 length:726 start_codon:yes stop_codon:yes gene_type:complete
MANYDPFMFSSLQGQQGGPGQRWEGQQKGISRDILREWAKEQAKKVSDAAGGLNKASLLAKAFGAASMFIPGVREATLLGSTVLPQFLTGALVTGGTQKLLGDEAVSGLSMEDAPDVLYGVDEARELETTAHSAIDKVLKSVNPSAVESAITTPLTVLSMRNMQNPYLTGKPGANQIESFLRGKGAELMGDNPISTAYGAMSDRFSSSIYDDSLLGAFTDFSSRGTNFGKSILELLRSLNR